MNFTYKKPLICVPVTAKNKNDLLSDLQLVTKSGADIIEWRVDHYLDDIFDVSDTVIACGTPIILTYRTTTEGGEGDPTAYEAILDKAITLDNLCAIDIELSLGEAKVQHYIKKAKEKNITSIVSSHYFYHTPTEAEMSDIFKKMISLGADIPKLAVMPKSFHDVLALMKVSYNISRETDPIIAISMGELGKCTRLCPSQMGSCLTFATVTKASAPGQVEIDVLKKSLPHIS